MLDRGIIWGTKREGSWKFRLAPYVIGFYEEQWDIMDHELAHLCEQYWCEGDAEGIMRPHPALHRVVPAHQSLKTEIILPYDDVKPLILQAKAFELRDCICRKQMDLVGKRKCNFPSRVCLNFSMRERPTGEYSITQEEALKVLDECEEVGLVHTVSNAAKGVFYVCNCCGICEERCQVKACSIEDGVATIDLSKCIGCGLCVTGCPAEAMTLKLRPDAEIITPPENYRAWEQERLHNRGLLK